MIRIDSKRNKFTYNIYHIVKSFYPGEDVEQKVDGEQEALVTLEMPGGSSFSVFPEDVGLPRISDPDERQLQEEKWAVTRSVYRYLENFTGEKLAWGILTGVRPTKLSRLDCEEGFSLYVGIPFCPSVCSYCSFSSSPIDVWRDRVDGYLDALIRELKALGEMAAGRRPDTVYIGGGTPTTLEPEQMDRLLKAVTEYFDLSHTLEFTIEAGRPDSITEEKLRVIRRYPVTRISVNPQTMQQKTLDLVGRKHTVQDVVEAFHMARRLGFDNINMDLIAGLPGETAADMQDTLRQVEALHPDSLTVHALAIKRAARFGQEGRTAQLHSEITQMIEDASECARGMGLKPYYLYRQKNIAGNFENVGYAEVDKAGIYNILIMEEKHTILAAGAGASTKILLKEPIRTENGKEIGLVRIENVKNITEYISRIDEMIERK